MPWGSIALLVVFAVVLYCILKVLRPRLRENRYKKWEEAGLLPEQVDPHTPRERDEHRDEPRQN